MLLSQNNTDIWKDTPFSKLGNNRILAHSGFLCRLQDTRRNGEPSEIFEIPRCRWPDSIVQTVLCVNVPRSMFSLVRGDLTTQCQRLTVSFQTSHRDWWNMIKQGGICKYKYNTSGLLGENQAFEFLEIVECGNVNQVIFCKPSIVRKFTVWKIKNGWVRFSLVACKIAVIDLKP